MKLKNGKGILLLWKYTLKTLLKVPNGYVYVPNGYVYERHLSPHRFFNIFAQLKTSANNATDA